MTRHQQGLALMVSGILILSPDALLIRLVGMDVFAIAVWRGLLQAIGLAVLLAVFFGKGTLAAFRAIGWFGLLIAVVIAAAQFAFLGGIIHTSVANALVIMASTPFYAAIMSRVLLGEVIALHTWIAIVVGLAGVTVIVWDGIGQGSWFGDLMALAAALLLAFEFTLLRSRRQINMIPATLIGAVLTSLVALGVHGQVPAPDAEQALWLAVMGLVVLPPATALMTLGPRYLSAPEVALILLLETVLGPIWVWLVIHEAPSRLALAGGAVVIGTLFLHAVAGLRTEQRRLAAVDLPPS